MEMKKNTLSLLALSAFLLGCNKQAPVYEVVHSEIRPSAYPLITIDPFTSAWSMTDNLYDENIKHWTEKDFPLIGAVKVDGTVYRFMGVEDVPKSVIAPTSEQGAWKGRYTTQKPASDWMNTDFNDSSWKEGPAAFGTTKNEATAKTEWDTDFIWVRRIINLDEDLTGKKIHLEYSHDDDVIIYINGKEVVNTGNACKKNVQLLLPDDVVATLKKGENIISAYCYNRVGHALLDFGLLAEKENVRILGNAAVQKSAEVQATQTHYTFTCGPVDLNVTFSAPMFMDDLSLLSRPVNYLSYKVTSNDNNEHDVALYFEASPAWALNKPLQPSASEVILENDLVLLKTGSTEQKILNKSGDDHRIDWGYFYMAAGKENAKYGIGNAMVLRSAFVNNKDTELTTETKENPDNQLAIIQKEGKVKETRGKIMLGYDDIYSIQYFDENLRPYCNADGYSSIIEQFRLADKEYAKLIERCYNFDKELMVAATEAGGKKYAELSALAYRQSISAHKLVKAPNGDLLFLSKENNSNGSIGTVDITYPSAPLYLLYNPELVKGLMNHILYYSESGKWTKPFAAHDVGTYPLANGQTYGGDMPVEESGNMLILTAALAQVEGNASYAGKHWEVLTVWANYLLEHGLDPDNQLCTDDFAGHFAHNTNLSIKAIIGIASYGHLADMLGKKDIAEEYMTKAKEMAAQWIKMADDKDHYRLTFDKPNTWSQKYNLVWDKMLGFNLFPEEVAQKELAYYLTKQNIYGLPLDNRKMYTKTDWIMWTATLAPDKETFMKFIDPVYKFYNETVDRIPMSDWVYTNEPNRKGFKARSVVGGYYIKMLDDKLKKNNK